MRSRSGAKLKYTENDVARLCERMPIYSGHIEGNTNQLKRVNPKKSEVVNGIETLVACLRQGETRGKRVLNIIYAGHGDPSDGGWQLKDGTLSGDEVSAIIAGSHEGSRNKLHIDLLLDSCYSARFPIDLMVGMKGNEHVYPFDCTVSSMPDEKSWEMNFIEHGALSYSLIHTGNEHVDGAELARTIDTCDRETVVKALQGAGVPNPVTLLTDGRQHSVELVSGHTIEVVGAGKVDLAEHLAVLTHAGLADCLYRAKSAYGEDVCYEVN